MLDSHELRAAALIETHWSPTACSMADRSSCCPLGCPPHLHQAHASSALLQDNWWLHQAYKCRPNSAHCKLLWNTGLAWRLVCQDTIRSCSPWMTTVPFVLVLALRRESHSPPVYLFPSEGWTLPLMSSKFFLKHMGQFWQLCAFNLHESWSTCSYAEKKSRKVGSTEIIACWVFGLKFI